MTARYASKPPRPARAYRFNLARVLFCGVLLFLLLAGCLLLHRTAFRPTAEILKESGRISSPKILTLASYWLPLAVLASFLHAVYARDDRRDGTAQWEMYAELLIAAVLTYALLLPLVGRLSAGFVRRAAEAGRELPMTDGGVPRTPFLEEFEWFVRLSVILALLLVFHHARARRETARHDRNPAIAAPEEPAPSGEGDDPCA